METLGSQLKFQCQANEAIAEMVWLQMSHEDPISIGVLIICTPCVITQPLQFHNPSESKAKLMVSDFPFQTLKQIISA